MYIRYHYGDHWCDRDSDDLYDSDDYKTYYEEEDSFEALCRFESQVTPSTFCTSIDSLLANIDFPTPHSDKESNQDSEEGIPHLVPNVNGNLIPDAPVECPLPFKRVEHPDNGSGETSVFGRLASESAGQAAEIRLPACKPEVSTSPGSEAGPGT